MSQLAFHHVLLLLAGSVLAVAAARRLHLPPVLGYLVTGIVLGPHGAGLIPDAPGTRYLAEFGLVFLLFSVGLEFSLSQVVAMRRTVLGLGGAQVLLSIVVFAFAALLAGMPPSGAVVVGGVLAMSSTAIVMKVLIEQLEQHSPHGRSAFAILLFQDMVVVPFLIFIPLLAGAPSASGMSLFGWLVVNSVLVLAVFYVAGRWLLRPLLIRVARLRSREFFTLGVLLVVLTSAWLTQSAGLSLALGAFIAGLMISETEYRQQVEADILPFRDMLLGLFFVTTGMLLDLRVLAELWPAVIALVIVLLLFKTAVVALLGRAFGLDAAAAVRTGLVLAPGGEFGFALIVEAARYHVLGGGYAQTALAAVILSMLIAPFIVRHNGRLAQWMLPWLRERRETDVEAIRGEALSRAPEVIICGYGRSGQNLAWMLQQEDIRVLALDLDPVRVRDARDAGEPVVYGDSTRAEVLIAAGLEDARAVAVSYYDIPAALRVLNGVRRVRPELPVIVRTRDDADLERLNAAGATEVVPESLEGSLMIASHVLLLLGVPVSRIVRRVAEVRRDRYSMLRGFFHGGEDPTPAPADAYKERLHSVALPDGAYAVGRRLSELGLDGVTVTAVRRGGIRGPKPLPETRLQRGDVLVLYGTTEELRAAERALLRG